jgi:hypothetical protein
MTTYSVKGHEIEGKITKSAYDRKVVLFANNIIDELKKLNINRDDIEIKVNVLGNKNVPAVIEFWAQGHYGRFSYSVTKRFVDNMYIIMELVKLEVAEVLEGKKQMSEFFHTFESEGDRKEISKDIDEAKRTLGVKEDEKDLEVINKAYKKLAREHHPDAGGDLEEFKKVNKAHKLIKKEMGL